MAKSELPADKLRGMSAEELEAQRETLRQELWLFRQKVQTGTERQMNKIRVMKRDIARVNTILNEQRLVQ